MDDEDDSQSQSTEPDMSAFEVPLSMLLECLNIFGSAGPSSSSSGGTYKKWKVPEGESDHDDEGGDDEPRNNGNVQNRQKKKTGHGRPIERGIDAFFGGGGSEKRTSMRLSYAGSGSPLTLLLAEDVTGPTTTCEITTFEPEPTLELDIDNSKLLLKIILKSSWLRDALMEIDPSCEKIIFVSSPPSEDISVGIGTRRRNDMNAPMLRIQAEGSFGSTQMDYPNDKEVLETFECTKAMMFSYRFIHITKTLRAIQSSTKTSLRIDEEGVLSLQFLMPSARIRMGQEDDSPAFIEFRCLPLDEEMSD
ncbi:hypothetical protein AMATHDRAFT_57101 [Amanita thiersii Skay4041]|uniref:Uncharacterized protein n=1 Tax=Amanita thiersii Skay4041 TaxID=703135 RepID=A0A2A9NNC0_9AGAR|nr:hypothetical protein AMATHDRAFT_57101 [Amanita thiersii Skay4041]